jgi:hypothetical protein
MVGVTTPASKIDIKNNVSTGNFGTIVKLTKWRLIFTYYYENTLFPHSFTHSIRKSKKIFKKHVPKFSLKSF